MLHFKDFLKARGNIVPVPELGQKYVVTLSQFLSWDGQGAMLG